MLGVGLAGAVICVSDDNEEFLSRGEIASMSGYNRKADNFEDEEKYDRYKRMNSVRTEDLTGERYGW